MSAKLSKTSTTVRAELGRGRRWNSVPDLARHPEPPLSGDDQARTIIDWMYAMYQWGLGVQKDILRLEAAGKLAAGDPGSPPLPPPPPEGWSNLF